MTIKKATNQKKYTAKQKLALLTELVELRIYTGYRIDDIIGLPFSHFNYDAVKNDIVVYKQIAKEQDGK